MKKSDFLHKLKNLAQVMKSIEARNKNTFCILTNKELYTIKQLVNLIDISSKYLPEGKEL